MPGQEPKNGIVGDGDAGMEIPQNVVTDEGADEIKRAAKFAKSSEFKDLKKHLESRIEFYQSYLPDGTPVVGSDMTAEELGYRWLAANTIIGECRAIFRVYEQAAELSQNVDI